MKLDRLQRFSDLATLLQKSPDPDRPFPSDYARQVIQEHMADPVLVIGAGGIGCQLVKNLALCGFQKVHLVDMDRIQLSNLNRQFLFRQQDIGRYKAEIAAKRVNECSDCEVIPHCVKVQELSPEVLGAARVIFCGLDNVQARRWVNSFVFGQVQWDESGMPVAQTVRVIIDGGTEGLNGQCRVIIPGKTACYECTLGMLSSQPVYNSCTLASTPRIPQHVIVYCKDVQFPKVAGRQLDPENDEDFEKLFELSLDRAAKFGIQGIDLKTVRDTVKNTISAVASTNAIIAGLMVHQGVKLLTGIGKVTTYWYLTGADGFGLNSFVMQKDPGCLVCNRPDVRASGKPKSQQEL